MAYHIPEEEKMVGVTCTDCPPAKLPHCATVTELVFTSGESRRARQTGLVARISHEGLDQN